MRPSTGASRTASSWLWCAHLLALWTLAIGEPLLRSVRQELLLSSAPDILVGQSRGSVIAFAVLVLAAPALLAWGTLRLVYAWRPTVSARLYMLAVTGLLVAIAVSVIGDVRGYLSSWVVFPALALGTAAAWLYRASSAARTFVTALLIAPLLSLPLFLARPPASQLVFGDGPPSPVRHTDSHVPVTVVVLDEFPLMALEGEDGRIDARRFPNFAALAREGTWYRRATTVHDYTTKAVPAIVTGRLAGPKSVPYWFDHRRSLFTALAGSSTARAWESSEDLCPNSLCADAPDQSGGLVRLLRGALRARARSLTNGRFGRRPYEDPGNRLREFIQTLPPRPRGGLEYVHVLLPHEPYLRLTSSRRYGDPYAAQPGLGPGEVWSDYPEASRLGRRRLEEQTGYLDTLIGHLVSKLRALEDFDRGLLAVVADHGAAFVPGEPRRTVGRKQVHEIGPVPLFVKYPNQRSGGASSVEARTVDVMPTVLRAVGKPVPAWVEGKPLQQGGSGGDVVTVHHSVTDLPPVRVARNRLERRESADVMRWGRSRRPRWLGERPIHGRRVKVVLLPESRKGWVAGEVVGTAPPGLRLIATVRGIAVGELARFGRRFYGLVPERLGRPIKVIGLDARAP